MFLDAQGKEIDRFVGFSGEEEAEETIKAIKDFAAGVNTLPALKNDLEANPADVELNYKLAKKHQARFEPDMAKSFFEKVLELDPEDGKGHKTEATFEIAVYEAQNNQNIEPLKAFISSGPDDEYLAKSYLNLGYTFQRKREYEKAVEIYEEALTRLPDNARLNYFYADTVINSRLEDLYDKALERNEKAKTLDPDLELSTVYNLFSYYRNTNNTEKVIETYEGAIQKWPDNNGLKSGYASAITDMEIESKYDYGIELLKRTLEADPESGSLFYPLGNLYHKKGELENAADAMRKAVEKYPTRKVYTQALEKIEKELAEKK